MPFHKNNGQILIYSNKNTEVEFFQEIEKKIQKIVVWRTNTTTDKGKDKKIETKGYLVNLGIQQLKITFEELAKLNLFNEETKKYCFDIRISPSLTRTQLLDKFFYANDSSSPILYCIVSDIS